jgi:hypothetical protein
MFQRLTAFAVLPLLLVAGEIGTVQNNVYHHNRTGIEFTLPSGWSVGSQKPSADGAQMVYVKDSVTEAMGAAWFKLQSVDAENIPRISRPAVGCQGRATEQFPELPIPPRQRATHHDRRASGDRRGR